LFYINPILPPLHFTPNNIALLATIAIVSSFSLSPPKFPFFHFVFLYIKTMPEEAPMKNLVCEKSRKALQFIEDVTRNADEVQRKVLAEILSRNANVEYLQRYGLNGNKADREAFKKVMPVVSYEDLKPDIDRIANGDTSQIICSQPISEFLIR
jgi:hypothetical protein